MSIATEAANVLDQDIANTHALYHGDCISLMENLPEKSVHLSLYSPPFAGLFHYSSSERDLSNARSYEEFMEHYAYVIKQLYRLTLPGRISAVHCMDVPGDGANLGGDTIDFPGDIIRLHKKLGWKWACRYHVWKEPLAVRNRTMSKSLAHRQVVEDSSLCENAAADQLLIFRKKGTNPIPIAHPVGLTRYAGSREVPHELLKFKGWTGKQTENRYSHWIWRQYASAFWDDVRIDRVLPYKHTKDDKDERHIHPLQLDVIERAVVLWSNPGETVLTPFMGVGSEAYGAVLNGRKAVGIELKDTYYRQAVANVKAAVEGVEIEEQPTLFPDDSEGLGS
jgi:DNA modification methylase